MTTETTDTHNRTQATEPLALKLTEGLGGNAEALRRDHRAAVARRKFTELPVNHRVVGWEDLGAAGVRYSFASFQRDLFGGNAVWGPVTHSTLVTPAEYLAEFHRVESEDKECAACVRGFEWSGWNHVTGHRFSTCSRCGGSALPPNVPMSRTQQHATKHD